LNANSEQYGSSRIVRDCRPT